MEKPLELEFSNSGETMGKRCDCECADDFVVFCESKEDAEQSVKI